MNYEKLKYIRAAIAWRSTRHRAGVRLAKHLNDQGELLLFNISSLAGYVWSLVERVSRLVKVHLPAAVGVNFHHECLHLALVHWDADLVEQKLQGQARVTLKEGLYPR